MQTSRKRAAVSVVVVATLVAGMLVVATPAAHAASITVNATNDAPDTAPGDGTCDSSGAEGFQCTLRAAIMEANHNQGMDPNPDTITVPGGTYTLTRCSSGPDAPSKDSDESGGDLDVTAPMTITGAGSEFTIVSGGGLNDPQLHETVCPERVFDIGGNGGINVTIQDLTIGFGRTEATASSGFCNGGGPGVRNEGSNNVLTLTDDVITNNYSSTDCGGAVSNPYGGTVHVSGGTIDHNTADANNDHGGGPSGLGAGIYNDGTMTLDDVGINANSAQGDGGGIFNALGDCNTVAIASIDITGGSVTGNTSGAAFSGGGGIYNAGAMTLDGVTVDSNGTSGNGGGIYNQGDPTDTVTSCQTRATLANNTTTAGMTIDGGSVSHNDAPFGVGGGIANDGDLTLGISQGGGALAGGSGVVIDDNTAINGGGVYNGVQSGGPGTLHGTDVAITNNVATGPPCRDRRQFGPCGNGEGGGLWNDSFVVLVSSDVSDNEAQNTQIMDGNFGTGGGGIYNEGIEQCQGSRATGPARLQCETRAGTRHHRRRASRKLMRRAARVLLADGGEFCAPAEEFFEQIVCLDNTTVDGNSAGNAQGGGVYNGTNGLFVAGNNSEFGNGPTEGTTGGNVASEGGGLYNDGGMFIVQSIADGNSSSIGGGFYNEGDGSMTVQGTSILDNVAGGTGGSGRGGGLYNAGIFGGEGHSENDTFNNNTARALGGAVYNGTQGTVASYNWTVNGNVAQNDFSNPNPERKNGRHLAAEVGNPGNNFYNAHVSDTGGWSLLMTIVSGGNGQNCSGTFTSGGYNIDDDGTCGLSNTGDKQTNPKLGNLGVHGGGTPTYDLQSGSPAIDGGDPNNANCPETDETTKNRPLDGDGNGSAICDVGAFEAVFNPGGGGPGPQPTPTVTPTQTPTVTPTPTPTPSGSGSPTPTPTPTPTGGTDEFDTGVTLGFTPKGTPKMPLAAKPSGVKGVFHGRVTSVKTSCIRGRRIRLMKVKHGHKKFVARTFTKKKGHFRFRRRHSVHGKFFARAKRKTFTVNGTTTICRAASSPKIKVTG